MKLVKVTIEELQWKKYDCIISINYLVRYKDIGVLVGTFIHQPFSYFELFFVGNHRDFA